MEGRKKHAHPRDRIVIFTHCFLIILPLMAYAACAGRWRCRRTSMMSASHMWTECSEMKREPNKRQKNASSCNGISFQVNMIDLCSCRIQYAVCRMCVNWLKSRLRLCAYNELGKGCKDENGQRHGKWAIFELPFFVLLTELKTQINLCK